MKKKHVLFALISVGILVVVLLAAWPRPKPEVLYEVGTLRGSTLNSLPAGPQHTFGPAA